jgi:hypothetical protein
MGKIFDSKGKLHIPLQAKIHLPDGNVEEKSGELVISEAYCRNGHDLISDVKIDGHKGIHLIYANADEDRETEIVITSIVGKSDKEILKGEAFAKDETVRILCPRCREELPILLNCECGAPIYLFYIDKKLNHNYGQSLCSRIGCVKSSRLRFSQDVLRETMNNYSL